MAHLVFAQFSLMILEHIYIRIRTITDTRTFGMASTIRTLPFVDLETDDMNNALIF